MMIDTQARRDFTRHLRDLIEDEVRYPVNVLTVLRELPTHELHAVEAVFEKMRAARLALTVAGTGRVAR